MTSALNTTPTATTPAEHPILFSGPMVRALLYSDGVNRGKTVTRRAWQPPKGSIHTQLGDGWYTFPNDKGWYHAEEDVCPYGRPGDRLWVRETWRPSIAHHCVQDTCDCGDVNVTYAADKHVQYFTEYRIPSDWTMPKAAKVGNVSSIFMPRRASRITLEVTEVSMERLHDITELDVMAEGFQETRLAVTGKRIWHVDDWPTPDVWDSPLDAFRGVWTRLNGRASWDANPFVWVVRFNVLSQPTAPTSKQ